MEQQTIFDILYPKFKIDKPIRLIEMFAGYGSQALALKYLGVKFEHWKLCEWAVKSIQAYKDIHFTDVDIELNQDRTKEEMVEFLYQKGISADYNKPMTQDQHNKLHKEKLAKTKICIECGKEFIPPVKHRGRNQICSSKCWKEHQKKVSPFKNIQVSSYKDGILVKTYNSIKEASYEVNGLSTNIVKCLKGKIKSAYGYQWKYL